MAWTKRTIVGLALAAGLTSQAWTADRTALDAKVQATLTELRGTVTGSSEILDQAKGVLVIPEVTKGGFVVGIYGGEGALLVGGDTVDYYGLAGASVGLLAGLETSSQVLAFLTDEAHAEFRNADGWEAGAGANVTLLQTGAAGRVDTTATSEPIVAFVFGQSGLMAGVDLSGAKYTRLEP